MRIRKVLSGTLKFLPKRAKVVSERLWLGKKLVDYAPTIFYHTREEYSNKEERDTQC